MAKPPRGPEEAWRAPRRSRRPSHWAKRCSETSVRPAQGGPSHTAAGAQAGATAGALGPGRQGGHCGPHTPLQMVLGARDRPLRRPGPAESCVDLCRAASCTPNSSLDTTAFSSPGTGRDRQLNLNYPRAAKQDCWELVTHRALGTPAPIRRWLGGQG